MKYLLSSNILISQNYDEHVNSIRNLLNNMTMEKSTIVRSSKNITLNEPLTEEHYCVKYEINTSNVTKYQGDKYVKSFVPDVNNLITEDLLTTHMLLQQDRIVKYDSNHDIYYDLANEFKEDKIFIKMNVVLTDLVQNKNVNNYMLLSFLINYINIVHSAELYDLSIGLCDIDIDVTTTKLHINITTYSHNVLEIIDKVFGWIKNTTIVLDDVNGVNSVSGVNNVKILNIIKEQFIRQIENKQLDPPYIKIKKIIDDLFRRDYTYTYEQILTFVNGIDYSQIAGIVSRTLSKGFVQCAITGNLNEELSQNISEKIGNFIQYKPLHSMDLANDLGQTSSNIVDNQNEKDKNSACKMIYMLDDVLYGQGEWTKQVCNMAILLPFLNAEFFHYMRTIGKAGYIATARKINMNTTGPLHKNGIYFLTQSHKFTVVELLEKTNSIINNDIAKRVTSLSDDEFINLKLGLISTIKSPNQNVYMKQGEIMNMIKRKQIGGDIVRDYKEQLLSTLVGNNPMDVLSSGITKYDVINYFNSKFINNPLILSVSIQAQ